MTSPSPPIPPNLFAFERDEFADLNWMPLALRHRLDLCGLKLSLSTWQRLAFEERVRLLGLPCDGESEKTGWASQLKAAVAASEREEPPAVDRWIDPEAIPVEVQEKLAALGSSMKDAEWRRLKPVERYALCKLARSKQADRYFPRAVREVHPPI